MPTVTETMAPPSTTLSFSDRLKLNLNDGAKGAALGAAAGAAAAAKGAAGAAATGANRRNNKGPTRSRSSSRSSSTGSRKNGDGNATFRKPSAPVHKVSKTVEPEAEKEKESRLQEGDQEVDQEQEQENADVPLGPKHPLLHGWTLWHFKNDPRGTWDSNLVAVCTFHYVEDFWGLYNHLELASNLLSGMDYCLFREGVRPAWEDDANKNGGRWVLGGLDPSVRENQLDAFWLEVMMFLIGAEAETDNMVNGAVVMVRHKGDKICVWCRDSKPQEDVMAVGMELKKRLGIHRTVNIGFEDHKAAKNKRGARGTNFMYSV